jgi:hypothetical protein
MIFISFDVELKISQPLLKDFILVYTFLLCKVDIKVGLSRDRNLVASYYKHREPINVMQQTLIYYVENPMANNNACSDFPFF